MSFLRAATSGNVKLLTWLAGLAPMGSAMRKRCLAAAAEHGRIGVLRWLEKMGITPDECRARSDHALRVFCKTLDLAGLRWLRKMGATLEDCKRCQLATAAAGAGRVDVLRWLREAGATDEYFHAEDGLALRYAIVRDRTEAVRWLVAAGLRANSLLWTEGMRRQLQLKMSI